MRVIECVKTFYKLIVAKHSFCVSLSEYFKAIDSVMR